VTLVAHHLLALARGFWVSFTGVIVVDFAQLAAVDQEVAMGQFLEAVVHGERVDGGRGASTLRTARGTKVSSHVAAAGVTASVNRIPSADRVMPEL
jgi:hypothetical protein